MPLRQDENDEMDSDMKHEDALPCERTYTDPYYLDQHILTDHNTVKTYAPKLQVHSDNMYPPKKRAMYDYMRQNSIEQHSGELKHVNDTVEKQYVDKPGYNVAKLPIKQDTMSRLEQCQRPRSDSMKSVLSLSSDNSSTVSSYSRDRSPYTIPEIRDHHTPERNSMVGRLGPNSDISKPLFPSSDSENSDEEDNLCMEDNSGNNFTFHKTNPQGSVIYKNVHENHSYTFHKHIPEPMTNNIGDNSTTCTANYDTDTSKAVVQNTQQVHEVHVMSNTDHSINSAKLSISGTRHTNTVANSSISNDPQTNFMGPMVSLLDRFNTADVPKGLDQKSKIHLDNKSIQRQCNDPVALNMIKSDNHMDSKSVPHTPLTDISKHFTQRQNSETAALNMIKSDNHMDSKSVPQTPLTDISKHFTQRQNSEPAALNMIKSDNHVVNEIYKCSLCDREFRQSGNFLNHMKTHSNVTCRCKCGLCDQEFDTSDGLQLHMRSHHTGSNPYKCQHCDREFSQYNNLRRHVRMHREKIYKCKLCDREFNEEFYLTMHMGTHTGHRVYSCGVCNAGFQSSHDLKTHVKTHSPSQLHVCTVCGKAFSKACVLRQHKKAHSGERPHKCTECTKTFIHRHHLTMHLRSHTSAKPYTCEYCNKEFSQSSHLYKHVRQHAEEDSKENVGGIPPQQDLILPNSNIGHVNMVKGNNNYIKPVLQNKSDSTLVENNHNQTKYLISLAPNDAKMSIAHDMKPVNQTKRRRLSAAENTASSANQFNVKTIPITPVPNLYPNLLPQFLPPVSPITHLPPHLAMMFGATPRPVTNLPSFEQMYQQYASQFHTYYNTYLMTYMSQAAMLGQGHLPPLQGHHQGQSAPQLHLTEQQLQGHIYQGHSVPQVHSTNEQKHSESISTKTHKNQEQTSALTRSQEDRKSDNVEQPTRTEIAHELLKMATPVHHDHHNHDNTREHCNTTEHHNVTERQHVPEDHDITEGLKGDSHKTSSDKEHVSVRLSNNADDVTDSYRTPHQPLIQGNDYSVSCVTNDDESPALNLSQNHKDTSRHSKYVQKIHQLNHTAKDNGTSRSYMFNHCDGLSSASVVTQSHPVTMVTVPLPSSLACDKTGHFHINKLMSGENSHTHVTASSHRTQKEAKFLDLSRESPAGHTCMSPEITTYGHSSGVISNHANHAIMDSSSPVVHSTNSLLSFSQAFSVPKASYQSENVKNQTEYSNLPGFRTVSKADSLNKETQQNGSAQTRVSMEKTTGAHLATVNTPRLYLPMEGNQSIPHSEVETNVNNSEVVKAVNDTLRYESSAYLEMSSDEAAPEDCRSPMNQPEPDTGEAMADVDNVSEMDTGNEVSSDNDGSFELQTNESDNVKVKQKEGSFELQASESDDIKDLRRKITEIKNIIEAGIHGEISDEDTEYTEMDTRDNTEKCEGNLKELETEISSVTMVTDTLADSTAVEKEVGYTEMEQMDNRKSNMREMCVDSTEHSLGCTDSHEGNTNRIYNGLKDKKCEISLHKSQNGVELTINVETVESIPNVDRNALSKHAIDMRMPVDDKVNESTEHALDCRTHNECKLCQRKFDRPFDLQCHMLMKHKEHFGSNHGNNGDCKNRDTDKHDHDDEGEKPDLNKTPNSQIKAPKTVIQMTHSEKSNENKIINIGIRCKYCNKMSGGERSYCDHVQTHSVQKPFICAICSRDFAHKHNLNRHMMSHNAKNHPCDECGRSFKEKYYLQMHRKIHAKEKIRDCEICGREVLKSEFWGHMNTHLGGILENPTYDQIGERVKELVHDLNLEKKNATKWRANKNDSQETDQEMRSVLKVGKVHLLTAKDVNKNEMENISFERDHGKENIQIASNMKIRSRLSPVSDRNIPLDFKLDNRRVIQQSKVLKEKVLVIRSNAEAANMDLVESVPDSTTD